MPLFERWCDCVENGTERKRLWLFTEKAFGRQAIVGELPDLLRSHYDEIERIADDVRALGFEGAAAILAERMPRTRRARSGEMGEILATELIEEELGFDVPIRRLRYKDGREMALRGDDFVGIGSDDQQNIKFLKGEAKSRAVLTRPTINEARLALTHHSGRPNPISLLFVADRLIERGGPAAELGRLIRNEVASRAVSAENIDHVLFTLSGNSPPQALAEDLQAADSLRTHTVIHLRIEDHQEFIRLAYEGALALGDA